MTKQWVIPVRKERQAGSRPSRLNCIVSHIHQSTITCNPTSPLTASTMHQLARIRATFSLGLILLILIILLSIFVPGLSANGKTISKEQTRNLRKSGVAKKRLSAGVPSVQIDNGTSLDPYKDSYLFKRPIIFLLLPNYLNRKCDLNFTVPMNESGKGNSFHFFRASADGDSDVLALMGGKSATNMWILICSIYFSTI